ncbi:MAG: cupredoxin domain-containing protein [Candidatus Nanoarchaeia archaeon]
MKRLFFFFFLLLLAGCASETVSTGETKEFTLTARNWEFEPSTITVNEGDTVVLHITGEDDGSGTGHGIAIPAFGVDKTFRNGESVDITFVADRKGTFPFFCQVYCGEGHGDMKGTLIVQ